MADKNAIIGGGIAGLTAAYLLNDVSDITLYEKDGRIGGNTQTLHTKDGHVIDISVFFYNRVTYPNFFKLLDKLGFEITTSGLNGASMTMLDLDTGEMMRYDMDSRQSIFRKKFEPRAMRAILKMAWNAVKGMRMNQRGEFDGLTMEEALKKLPGLKGQPYYLLIFPLCLMSSMYHADLLKAPATYFFDKLEEHYGTFEKAFNWGLINPKTEEYTEALAAGFKEKIVFDARIKSIARDGGRVTIRMDDGSESVFDNVVFACNADQALEMLEDPTEDEKRLLGAWKYTDGLVVVHKDDSFFPEKEYWSMYDCLYTDRDGEINTSINACYYHEEGVDDSCKYLGTQHPNFPIKEELIEFRKVFRTPKYDFNSAAVIKEMNTLNGVKNSYYCGSHFGYGLHEDSVRSAIIAAKMLGAEWELEPGSSML